MTGDTIKEQLRHLPNNPGVYIFKDVEGTILYVGKATNLHNRVRSYFASGERLLPKTERLVAHIDDLDYFIVNSEQEALILECNLIKRYRPHYNVRLKDDKGFPYLRIDLNEDWPKVYITRRLEENGGHYFGPFTSAKSIRQTVKFLKGIFPFRSCFRTITGKDARPCLDFYLHRCNGPCIGAVTKAEYADVIKQVILFLEGKQEKIVKGLQGKMVQASEALDYEKAALLRDQIQALEKVIEGQKIATTVRGEEDVIAFAQDKDHAFVQVFFIRNGKLIGRESFILQGTGYEEPQEIMSSFIKQFYGSSTYLPPLLLLQYPVEDKTLIEEWLKDRRKGKVSIEVPTRGNKKQLVDIVAHNAEEGLQLLKIKEQATGAGLEEAMAEIQKELNLPTLPVRMECYDISDIQGKAAVGSMVVFEDGKPKPAHYRRFKIKTISGANDYAMLQEVLRRRFKRSASKDEENSTWAILPDLVLIDGGKGQLSAALEVMQELGADTIPVAGLAKENEEIFLPHQSEPIVLPRSSPGLQMLERIRDEAHRFAVGYHHKIHRRESFVSALDTVPGVGPKRKRALLKQFGSVRGIKEASVEELATAQGMTEKLAKKVKEYL